MRCAALSSLFEGFRVNGLIGVDSKYARRNDGMLVSEIKGTPHGQQLA